MDFILVILVVQLRDSDWSQVSDITVSEVSPLSVQWPAFSLYIYIFRAVLHAVNVLNVCTCI